MYNFDHITIDNFFCSYISLPCFPSLESFKNNKDLTLAWGNKVEFCYTFFNHKSEVIILRDGIASTDSHCFFSQLSFSPIVLSCLV
jgi:hypothetical protein